VSTGKPVVYVGQSVIASWLGVNSQAVSNWIRARHTSTVPVPDVVVVSERGGEVLGWTAGRRGEWVAWYADAKASPTPRGQRYVTDEDRKGWQ
jgi:hypothetical protein